MNISPAVQKAVSRSLLQVQKHAPTILTTVGVVSVVAAGVLAAKNTLKLEERIDEGQDRLRWANEQIEEGELPENARTAVYIRNVVEVTKLYMLPGTLMLGGIAAILGGQHILNKRNAALVAAYNGIAASYEAYRERVREEVGEERERELYFGEQTETQMVDGKKTVVKTLVDGEHVGSPYRFVYDQSNENWTGFHDENVFRLTVAQNMYNDLLKRRGHIFLRDILITLGIEPTHASAQVGWVFDENDPNHQGDNFIEFNIRDYQDDSRYGFIVMDFNVDGIILDKI
ncbi:hypothetical protein SEA_DIZZYRUDY_48 [Microbacterium phage DizzyRudy]|nr:hypothetical protein SEA_DIZZYRUDY_48 [Microbacterium phage DizzyRudy]